MKIGPGWLGALEMAKEWGRAPWEIFGGRKTLWVMRWQAVREAESEVAEALRKNG